MFACSANGGWAHTATGESSCDRQARSAKTIAPIATEIVTRLAMANPMAASGMGSLLAVIISRARQSKMDTGCPALRRA